jgi:hypothetical protein
MALPAHRPTGHIPQTSLVFPSATEVTDQEFEKLHKEYGFMNKEDITKNAEGKFYWKGQEVNEALLAFLNDKDADSHGGPTFRS